LIVFPPVSASQSNTILTSSYLHALTFNSNSSLPLVIYVTFFAVPSSIVGGFSFIEQNGITRLFYTVNATSSLNSVDYTQANNSFGNQTSIILANSPAFANSYLPTDIEWNGVFVLQNFTTVNQVTLVISAYNYHSFLVSWFFGTPSTVTLATTFLAPQNIPLGNQIKVQGSVLLIDSMRPTGPTQGNAGSVVAYNITAPPISAGYVNSLYVFNGSIAYTGYSIHAYVEAQNAALGPTVRLLYPSITGIQTADIRGYLTVNINGTSANPITASSFTITASNSFSNQTVTLPLGAAANSSSGLAWWAWFLISISIVVAIVVIVLVVLRIRKNREDTTNENPEISVQPIMDAETGGNTIN